MAAAVTALAYAGHEVFTTQTTTRIGVLGSLLKYNKGTSQATSQGILLGFTIAVMSKVRVSTLDQQVDHSSHALTNLLTRLGINMQLSAPPLVANRTVSLSQ